LTQTSQSVETCFISTPYISACQQPAIVGGNKYFVIDWREY